MMQLFVEGFVHGAATAARAYFAPAVALWRLLMTTTDELAGRKR